MFPVRAVNQILFEPLCTPVQNSCRLFGATLLKRSGEAAAPRRDGTPEVLQGRVHQPGWPGQHKLGFADTAYAEKIALHYLTQEVSRRGCPTLGVGRWVLGFPLRSSFPSSLKNVDRKKCGPRSCVIPPAAP